FGIVEERYCVGRGKEDIVLKCNFLSANRKNVLDKKNVQINVR
ncbi:hypothetical protein HMPREF1033_01344, partial [Tannerella sp. 6_1_58FAA_CT1]